MAGSTRLSSVENVAGVVSGTMKKIGSGWGGFPRVTCPPLLQTHQGAWPEFCMLGGVWSRFWSACGFQVFGIRWLPLDESPFGFMPKSF